jgi:hypothetical protein
LLVEEGDTRKEGYEAMINDCVLASKALRTYIDNHSEMDGSTMKDFDNMKSLLNKEAENTPGVYVQLNSIFNNHICMQ